MLACLFGQLVELEHFSVLNFVIIGYMNHTELHSQRANMDSIGSDGTQAEIKINGFIL